MFATAGGVVGWGGIGEAMAGRKFGIQTDENGQTRVKPNYVY